MSTRTVTKPTTTNTLATRRARYVRDYRQAATDFAAAMNVRDTAIVNYFRTLPETETVEVTNPKTATTTRTTKPVSDNQRAKDTLAALAVSVDDKGRTNDVFALAPQRVVQIVKAYRRAEQITATATTSGALAPALESEAASTLATALTTAAKSDALGDKGADALAETLAKSLADSKPEDVVKAADTLVREATAKAKDAAKVAKVEAAAKDKAAAPAPVVLISGALDSLESALAGAKDLDPQQKSMLLQRLESLALHLK